jgi:hypothetical protein
MLNAALEKKVQVHVYRRLLRDANSIPVGCSHYPYRTDQ